MEKISVKGIGKFLLCLLKVVFYYAIYIALYYVVTLGTALFTNNLNDEGLLSVGNMLNANNTYIYVGVTIVALLIYYAVNRKIRKEYAETYLPSSSSYVLYPVLFGVLGGILVNIIPRVLGAEQVYSEGTVLEGIVYYIGFIFVVPVLEEMLFRYVLCISLKRLMSVKAVIIISAVIFAVFHMDLYKILYTLPLGMMLALLFFSHKRISNCFAMHCAFNFGCVLFTVPAFYLKFSSVVSIVLAVLIIPALVCVTVKIIKDCREAKDDV